MAGSINIRKQMSGKAISSTPVVSIAGYHSLSDFEYSVIINPMRWDIASQR